MGARRKRGAGAARRSRLEPFRKLATTLKARMRGVLRAMLDGRSNDNVEATNSMRQQTETPAADSVK